MELGYCYKPPQHPVHLPLAQVSPNPVASSFHFQHSNMSDGYFQLRLYDLTGNQQQYWERTAFNGQYAGSFDLDNDLPAGVYLLTVLQEDRVELFDWLSDSKTEKRDLFVIHCPPYAWHFCWC